MVSGTTAVEEHWLKGLRRQSGWKIRRKRRHAVQTRDKDLSPAAAKSCQSILSRLNLKASVVQHPSDRALRDTGIQLFQEATQICESTRLQTRFCVRSFNPDSRKILRSHHRHRRAMFLFSCPFIIHRQTGGEMSRQVGRQMGWRADRQTERRQTGMDRWADGRESDTSTGRKADRRRARRVCDLF